MNRRMFLKNMSVLFAATASSTTLMQCSPKKRCNFIFILIDDMGWTDLACYGSEFYETPHVDRLAREGMKFTDAYAACPVCSPTRASIMTGKYPATLNLTDWIPGWVKPYEKLKTPDFKQELALEQVTIAEMLKQHGYTTAHIGKWHLGNEPFYPEHQGFDVNIAGDKYGAPASYFCPYKNRNRQVPDVGEDCNEGEYLTDRLTDEAVDWIEQNQSKPFFLYLPHYAVHTPIQAKEDLTDYYRNKINPELKQDNPKYAAMVHSVDESVGRIMKKLEELNLTDNTVVFFMSDNGGFSFSRGEKNNVTDNSPLRRGKGYIYEGGIREPMIVKAPGITQPGSICKEPVSSVDFYPTILELAGISLDHKIDGVSVVPLLTKRGTINRDALYWHYPHYSPQGGTPACAIRQGDYKLIEFFEDGHLELYNLLEDIGEKNNLVDTLPEKAGALHKKLVAWRESVNAGLPTLNPDYDPERTEEDAHTDL